MISKRILLSTLLTCLLFIYLFDETHGEYTMNKCYCIDELDDILRKKEFIPTPEYAKYEYGGVHALVQNIFEPCSCSDVTRIHTPYVFIKMDDARAGEDNHTSEDYVKAIVDTYSKFSENETDFNNIGATFISKNDNGTKFEVEIVLKGHKAETPHYILENLRKTASSLISTFGRSDEDVFKIYTPRCNGFPPEAPERGILYRRNLKIKGFPGEKATYSCEKRYVVEDVNLAYSQCSHTTFNWSDPMGSNNCSKGCATDPPREPKLMNRHWDVNQRKDKDIATYACMDGYRFKGGKNGTSLCRDYAWTPLPDHLICLQIMCVKQTPPNVDHGIVTGFDLKSPLYVGTELRYSCKNGFCSNYDEDIIVKCLMDGTWSNLTEDFGCFPKKRFYCLTKRIQQLIDQQYMKAKERLPSSQYFLTTTIPCIIALGLFLFCAIITVRLDSPLYWCCTATARKQNYRVDQY